jgi:enoyl-CoA hydratase
VSPEWNAGATTMVGGDCLVVERAGDVRWLWLNRPERRNALDPELVLALDEAVRDAARDPQTLVVVIAGRGPSFCAGADLRHLHDLATTGRDPLPFLGALSATFTRLERLPIPVLAAVHGHVVAGGLELALACDVVIARQGTVMGDGHLRNGLLPAGGGSVRLPRKVGEPMATWLMLTGELLPAEAFLSSGFVRAVATETEFPAVLAANLDLLRARSGPSHGRVKQLLAAGHQAEDEAYAAELDVFGDHWTANAAHTAGALARFLAGQR